MTARMRIQSRFGGPSRARAAALIIAGGLLLAGPASALHVDLQSFRSGSWAYSFGNEDGTITFASIRSRFREILEEAERAPRCTSGLRSCLASRLGATDPVPYVEPRPGSGPGSPIPEPSAALLFAAGLLTVARLRRER